MVYIVNIAHIAHVTGDIRRYQIPLFHKIKFTVFLYKSSENLLSWHSPHLTHNYAKKCRTEKNFINEINFL